MEIIAKVYTSLFCWKINQNYNKIPCFVKMKFKKQHKVCGISQQNMWFSITKYL